MLVPEAAAPNTSIIGETADSRLWLGSMGNWLTLLLTSALIAAVVCLQRLHPSIFSHLEVHDYFQRHPEQFIYGSDPSGFKRDPAWNEHTGWTRLANSTVNHGTDSEKYTVVPYEFTGKAGDAVFWHPLCMHDGSINLQPSPRETVIVTITRRFDEAAGLPPRDYAKRSSDLFAGWPALDLDRQDDKQCRQDTRTEH